MMRVALPPPNTILVRSASVYLQSNWCASLALDFSANSKDFFFIVVDTSIWSRQVNLLFYIYDISSHICMCHHQIDIAPKNKLNTILQKL